MSIHVCRSPMLMASLPPAMSTRAGLLSAGSCSRHWRARQQAGIEGRWAVDTRSVPRGLSQLRIFAGSGFWPQARQRVHSAGRPANKRGPATSAAPSASMESTRSRTDSGARISTRLAIDGRRAQSARLVVDGDRVAAEGAPYLHVHALWTWEHMVQRAPKLQVLHIEDVDLGSGPLEWLCKGLRSHSEVQVLKLIGVHLGPAGGRSVGAAARIGWSRLRCVLPLPLHNCVCARSRACIDMCITMCILVIASV